MEKAIAQEGLTA